MGFLQYKKISFTRTNDNESLDAKHNPNKLSYDTKPKIIHQETDDMTITTPENKKSKSPTIIPGFGNWSFSLFYDETDLSITPLMSSGTTTYDKVVDKIEELKKHLLDIVPSEHKSAQIKVKFGSIEFLGNCTSFKVDYIDFDITGEPLSAEINLQFLEEPNAADVQSPDITHLITIKEGDHMANIVKKIYGSPIYVTDVARANNLTSFRGIESGSKLYFPPLQ
jgi:hypothetical protein